MDETEKTGQDSPPTGVTDQLGQASTGGKGSTSDKEPETLTKEQVQKQISDALSAAGRDAKSLSDREQAVKDAEAERDKWLEEREKTELEAIKDDPDLLTAYKSRKAIEAERQQVAKDRAQVKADAEAVSKTTRESTIARLATEYNVTTEWLSGLGVTDPKALEEIAKASGKKGEPKPRLKVDSGKTIGGAGDLSGLSPAERKKERERVAYKTE